jgi:hypothetical protein
MNPFSWVSRSKSTPMGPDMHADGSLEHTPPMQCSPGRTSNHPAFSLLATMRSLSFATASSFDCGNMCE